VATLVVDRDQVSIPAGIETLDAFRRWVHSDDFPETGRICFFHDEVWVDMSKEQFFSHDQVKGDYSVVLSGLARRGRTGRYVYDGMLFVNEEVGLCCQPDGAFVLSSSLRSGKVRLSEGVLEGVVELEGSPDMTLEVVSASSVIKDTEILFDLYWRAGVSEYWLVDARGERLSFEIFRRGPRGYIATRKQNGWIKSHVFGKSFRLTRRKDDLGYPEYTLHVRG
jgi:Uma2 family endonuclease